MQKLTIASLLLVPAAALAQAPQAKQPPAPPAPPPAKAEMPKPPPAPPEVKATVDAFKGNWRFETTMSATGMPGMDKPAVAKMNFNCKEVAGKTAVACESKMKTPMGPFDGLFVVSYDPYSKAVHFMGITNMHEVHDHVCKWSGYELNCTPLKGGMGPMGDEITEDLKMKFEPAPTCKPKEGTDPMTSCPPKTVAFTSISKMTKGGATMTFEGKGKK
jgi:hypothetical protein